MGRGYYPILILLLAIYGYFAYHAIDAGIRLGDRLSIIQQGK